MSEIFADDLATDADRALMPRTADLIDRSVAQLRAPARPGVSRLLRPGHAARDAAQRIAWAEELPDRLRRAPRVGRAATCLLVLCHGVGADGGQVIHLASDWSLTLPGAAFVAPHAPFVHRRRRSTWLPFARRPQGREWFGIGDPGRSAIATRLRESSIVLGRMIDEELARLDLSPDAYVLAGFSQGAMLALHTGLRRAVPPRGILSFAGRLPSAQRLCAEIANRAPVLLVHGEADVIVPAVQSEAAGRTLRALGVPVTEGFLPGVGHRIDDRAIAMGADFLAATAL